MTAPARRSTDPAPALVPSNFVPVDHAQLQRELRQRSTTIATLRRELTRAIEAPTVVSVTVVDGMLTATLSSGAVLQRRARCVETHDSVEYGFTWMALEPIPGTRAAIVDAVMAECENAPEHYVTAGMRLVAGMAVTAGGAD